MSKPKNYDYTASARSARRYARAADVVQVTLDAEHAAQLRAIVDATGETKAGVVRRLIREEAERGSAMQKNA